LKEDDDEEEEDEKENEPETNPELFGRGRRTTVLESKLRVSTGTAAPILNSIFCSKLESHFSFERQCYFVLYIFRLLTILARAYIRREA
jgi:hypothetical protein